MVDRRPSGQAASGKDTVISSQVAVRSRREWSRRESSDIDEARKGERAGASEWSQRDTVRHRRSKAEVADRELGSSSQSIEVRAISVKPAGVWAGSQRLIPTGERSGLQTRIATMESVSLFALMNC
jgi:hypothetical protein